MSDKDKANLLGMIDALEKIQRYTTDHEDANTFYADVLTFDAVLMNLVIFGEMVARLSEKFKDSESDIPWSQIKGLRNIVAHNYFGVDPEEIWEIIQEDLPELEVQIKVIVKNDPTEN
ncbi:MAG: DUF86 domain-containing protein [Bacteroidota bacterium]